MNKLNIHCLQHVEFEGPAIIQKWAGIKGHNISFTRFYENDALPQLKKFDWLIIMGGPMSVNESDKYLWLKREINFIRQAIDSGKVVTGICLGAQLIARSLGAGISDGKRKEIGWFPVTIDKQAADKTGFSFLPEKITAFHWHGETFDIPGEAVHLASSGAFPNQAFIFNDRVLALQFHFEMDDKAIEIMLNNVGDELIPGTFVQTREEILANMHYLPKNNEIMFGILNELEKMAYAQR